MNSQRSQAGRPLDSASVSQGVASEGKVSATAPTESAKEEPRLSVPLSKDVSTREDGGGRGVSLYRRLASQSAPLFRPKKTCTGLEEELVKSGNSARVHWSSEESLHIHVSPSPGDSLSGNCFKQRERANDDWEKHGCNGTSSNPKNRNLRCIPCFDFAPKLCPKSEAIIISLRTQRIKELWMKLDEDGDDCADLFDLESIAHALLPSERRFLKVLIPLLVEQSVSRSNADAILDGGTLGPHFEASLRNHTQRPSVEGAVRIETLDPKSKLRHFPRQEDLEGLAESGEAEAVEQLQLEERALRVYRRLSRELRQIVLLNADAKVADASSRPMLFVPKDRFVKMAVELLGSSVGSSAAVDALREEIMKRNRRLVRSSIPESANFQLFKPHVLRYSRKLDERRRLERQRQREAEVEEAARRKLKPSIPVCGDPFCRVEEETMLMQRRWNRFDDQIRHFVRKRLQLEHVKQVLEDSRETEFATYHPQINDTPRYLRKLRSARLQSVGAETPSSDPMIILREFCSRFVPDETSSRVAETLQQCCFQPNADKFVLAEAKKQRQKEKAEKKEAMLDTSVSREGRSCCTGKEASEKADKLFQMLDTPFDAVFTGSICRWLRHYGEDWMGAQVDCDGDSVPSAASDGKGAKTELSRVSKAASALRRWEAEGREPQHRRLRQLERQVRKLTQTSKVEIDFSFNEAPQTSKFGGGKVKKSDSVCLKQRWEESLRGGYASPYLSFSKEPPQPKLSLNRRTAKESSFDWTDFIRMKARGLEPRAVPGDELIKEIVEDFVPSLKALPPTLWVHRRRREEGRNRIIGGSGRGSAASLTRKSRPSQPVQPTVFAVPTPPKQLQTRSAYEVYTQVRHEVESGALKIPPRVVGVRRDRLSDIEEQLKALPPILVQKGGDTKAES